MPLGIDFVQILLHLFNAVILFAGLYILLYAPVVKFMDKRADQIRDLTEGAVNAEMAAKKKVAEYDEKLKEAAAELAESKKEAAEEIEKLKKEQIAAAKEEARQILSDARAQAEREKKAIIGGAKQDISEMIEQAAKKLMQGEDAADPYEEFIKEAERTKANG